MLVTMAWALICDNIDSPLHETCIFIISLLIFGTKLWITSGKFTLLNILQVVKHQNMPGWSSSKTRGKNGNTKRRKCKNEKLVWFLVQNIWANAFVLYFLLLYFIFNFILSCTLGDPLKIVVKHYYSVGSQGVFDNYMLACLTS